MQIQTIQMLKENENNHLNFQLAKLKNSSISGVVNGRLKEFKELGKSNINEIFKELCFCIMTANCGAESCIKVQKSLGNDFLTLNEQELAARLKEAGYRFPNKRAHYILYSRAKKEELEKLIKNKSENKKSHEIRGWLVKNIKGLGFKEASHFLRNIGYEDLAIIDFHIIDILSDNNLIKKPKSKSLSKNIYTEIENELKNIAKKLNMNLAELDLYLWFLETGKILK